MQIHSKPNGIFMGAGEIADRGDVVRSIIARWRLSGGWSGFSLSIIPLLAMKTCMYLQFMKEAKDHAKALVTYFGPINGSSLVISYAGSLWRWHDEFWR